MAEKSSIFDMIGPVMIGPSSSHTAGVVRIARAAIRILGALPTEAVDTFYNSFARTYEGHGSDRAIVAGLLGYAPDDVRIRTAFEHAEAAGLKYTFQSIGNASTMHPNTIKVSLLDGATGHRAEVLGQSRGGGVIRIVEVDGLPTTCPAPSPLSLQLLLTTNAISPLCLSAARAGTMPPGSLSKWTVR